MIDRRLTRNATREISIGAQNSERSIIRMRSDLSEFFERHNERFVPARPEFPPGNPEQLMDGRQSTVRSFGVYCKAVVAEERGSPE